jgi:UDP-N-acetylglucosamine 2-epimerase (non-hydrolysing)
LVGVETESIVAEVSRLLDDDAAYQAMSKPNDLYGDGRAGERILQGLLSFDVRDLTSA